MSVNGRYEFGLALIREAGETALGYFNARDQLTVKNKGPQDLASEADLNTELLIRERLAKAFPQDAFLGEETQPTAYSEGQGIWVVDPIDGTQPFCLGPHQLVRVDRLHAGRRHPVRLRHRARAG